MRNLERMVGRVAAVELTSAKSLGTTRTTFGATGNRTRRQVSTRTKDRGRCGEFDNGRLWDRVPDAPERPENWTNPAVPPYSNEDLGNRFVDGVPSWIQGGTSTDLKTSRMSRLTDRVASWMDAEEKRG
jgi:hypothetical protein